MLKVAFAVACFSGLSDIHECSDGFKWLHLPLTSRQPCSCNSPHYWLMSLAMDLAALCDICGAENGTNECHLIVFSFDGVFARHFIFPHHSPPSTPVGVLVVLAEKLFKIVYSLASYVYLFNYWWIHRL